MMINQTASRLRQNIDKILGIWEQRVQIELVAAKYQGRLALRDSLPEYLAQLADALSSNIERTDARKLRDMRNITRIGEKHGKDRAESPKYTIDQLIKEYHILRQVLCDVLEEDSPLNDIELEVIVSSIEQGVNDASRKYSETLKIQKDKMTNSLTHDLRGPITTTKFSAQLILRKLDPDSTLVSKVKLIISKMDRLDQMITGLLDASRLEAGHTMPIEPKRCDLDAIIREVADELSLTYPDYFKVESCGKCEGFWDENGLRRVIENLLSNAIKYGFENKLITISLLQEDKSIELRVHNYGKPIPDKEIPHLFEQFRRFNPPDMNVGWGLGLTIVEAMVDAHKGSIRVESEEIEGTSFIISLPRDTRLMMNSMQQVPKSKESGESRI